MTEKKEGASMGPWLVISGYITDEAPELHPKIAEWAKSIGASVEMLNIEKLNKKDGTVTYQKRKGGGGKRREEGGCNTGWVVTFVQETRRRNSIRSSAILLLR